MLSSEFAEDIFVDFYKVVAQQKFQVQGQDFSPISSFYEKIVTNQELTRNQGNFLIKLLEKYKNLSANAGLDYRDFLSNVKWRNKFRILDLTKRIYVEVSEGKLEICLKFPYQLKKEFEDEINLGSDYVSRNSRWDTEDKVRRLNFYDFNLITLYEFAVKHNFEIDDSFMNSLAETEEIWQNSENLRTYCEVVDDEVTLRNASESTLEWWNSNKTNNVSQDLLIAKSMGFVFDKKPRNLVEKIAASQENSFWIKNNQDFFSLVRPFNQKIVVVLDRTSKTLPWLQNFVADAENSAISRNDIRVCFRDNKDSESGLNDWIKNAGVGGKVEDGKILIFESKPAKWLFKSGNDVIMLVTNNIYPPTNILARDWFSCHPCVLYLGETKPTETKGNRIVEL
jgi:hypothetical protein